jgi:hypothetical protein
MSRFERKITLREAEDIHDEMIRHHRLHGFLGVLPDNTVKFFDSKPSFGGALITLADLEFIIQARKIEVEHYKKN